MQDQILTELKFEPGVVTEQTTLSPPNSWAAADKIRFRFGKPELIGGWQNVTLEDQTAKLVGQPRLLESIRSLTGIKAAFIATNVGLFSSNLSTFYDITPDVSVFTGNNILSTTAGSRTVIVSVSAHGITDGSLVGIVSAATTIGGTVVITPTTSVTVAYQVSVIDANSFSIQAPVTATDTSALTGGNITVHTYYPAGYVSDQVRGGWGGGVWSGTFAWGSPTGSNITLRMRHWSADQWGTDMMAVPYKGPLMLWSPQSNIADRAVIVTAAPSVNSVVRVATEARHVLLYGTHDVTGTYDPLLIRWCSAEDYTDWTSTRTNTAGDFRLNSSGSEIVNVIKLRNTMLIFTDAELFEQAYIGPNDVFGFTRVTRSGGLLARNAAVEFNGVAYWIGANRQFYKYDGQAQVLPCTVLRYVFDGLDDTQKAKIYAGVNAKFSEIIWLYCSTDSVDGENDRYVIYNVVENHWTIGTLRRNAWLDSSIYPQILAVGPENAGNNSGLFYHETGYAAGTSALHASLTSDYITINSGDDILFCNKYVPDLQAADGTTLMDNMEISFYTRKYPGATPIVKGPYSMNGQTDKISIRLRGREMALHFESETSTDSKAWQLGTVRLGLQADGKR